MRSKRYDHLPSDIADALNGYDAMVDSGEIHFDASGYADDYPGIEVTDQSLAEFLKSKGADRA